jgi:hypothetical protein
MGTLLFIHNTRLGQRLSWSDAKKYQAKAKAYLSLWPFWSSYVYTKARTVDPLNDAKGD